MGLLDAAALGDATAAAVGEALGDATAAVGAALAGGGDTDEAALPHAASVQVNATVITDAIGVRVRDIVSPSPTRPCGTPSPSLTSRVGCSRTPIDAGRFIILGAVSPAVVPISADADAHR